MAPLAAPTEEPHQGISVLGSETYSVANPELSIGNARTATDSVFNKERQKELRNDRWTATACALFRNAAHISYAMTPAIYRIQKEIRKNDDLATTARGFAEPISGAHDGNYQKDTRIELVVPGQAWDDAPMQKRRRTPRKITVTDVENASSQKSNRTGASSAAESIPEFNREEYSVAQISRRSTFLLLHYVGLANCVTCSVFAPTRPQYKSVMADKSGFAVPCWICTGNSL
ncbi:hypothetical protein DFH06DRAFT_1128816 [Mycena polygramma]|nr:hypothetical protein DFH06DRAFT_1128816 [Mycena polygramma]